MFQELAVAAKTFILIILRAGCLIIFLCSNFGTLCIFKYILKYPVCYILCLRLLIFLQSLHLILSNMFCCLRVTLALKCFCFSTLHTFNVFMLVYFSLLYLSLSLLSSNPCSHGAPRCHCFCPPLLSLLELTMSHCPHCHRPVSGSLLKHIAHCPSAQKSKVSPKPHRHHSSLWKRPRLLQVIKPKSIEASLAGDTHTATHTRPSDLLHSCPSLSELINADSGIRVAHDTELDWSGSGPDYHVDDTDNIDSASNRQHTESQEPPNNDNNVASDAASDAAADTAFMQQFASFIDPGVGDPFCSSLFDEESM